MLLKFIGHVYCFQEWPYLGYGNQPLEGKFFTCNGDFVLNEKIYVFVCMKANMFVHCNSHWLCCWLLVAETYITKERFS